MNCCFSNHYFVLSEFLHLSQTHSNHLPVSYLILLLVSEISSIWQVLDSHRRLFLSICLGFGWRSARLVVISVSSVLQTNSWCCVSTLFHQLLLRFSLCPAELLWIGYLTGLILILKFRFVTLTTNINSQTFLTKGNFTRDEWTSFVQQRPFQLCLLCWEFQLAKLPWNDGEEDAGTEGRRKNCGRIKIYSDEFVFTCSGKFFNRENSDCI